MRMRRYLHRSRTPMSRLIWLAWMLWVTPAHADRTNVVVLVNGNAVTGEVKSLDFGALKYKTDSMGTLLI